MPTQTSYTDAVGAAIIDAVRSGLPVRFAAAKGGIGWRTVYDWLDRGENNPDRYPDLAAWAALFREAEAEYASQELARIDADAAADSNAWKARAWKLEKRFPREFGSKVALEHSGPDSGPIAVEHIESPEVAAARIETLLAALAVEGNDE